MCFFVPACMQLSHVIKKRYERFDAVVSSDLQRTIQTAQILAAGYQLEVSIATAWPVCVVRGAA